LTTRDSKPRLRFFLAILAVVFGAQGWAGEDPGARPKSLPTLEEALAAKTDVWGEAAMGQPDGPSFEFFAGLLPPLRYVNAAFHHYPIVLSAPRSLQKARLVSNGSAVNARAKLATWLDAGIPVRFEVGQGRKGFGDDLKRLRGPRYHDGWMPIVSMDYREGGTVYTQECFAPVDPVLADHGALFVRFGLAEGSRGSVAAVVEAAFPVKLVKGALRDGQGRAWIGLDDSWRWDAATNALTAEVAPGRSAALAIFTAPLAQPPEPRFSADFYEVQRRQCLDAWQEIIGRAATVDVPERVVQDAWRALIAGTLMIARGAAMNYSAGNQYQRMYAEESSSPIHALLLFGLADVAKSFIEPILTFQLDPRLKYHNAAFELQLLVRYYWLTRDAAYVRSTRGLWQPLVESIVAGREPGSGLLPKEHYCGDIATPVYSLNSNANCWRALRDMAAMLAELGEPSAELESIAKQYRAAILDAVAKSESLEIDPPFIPIALFGAEQPYETLTASMLGAYWILMSNYLLRSGVFDAQPEKADWIARYLEQRGGLSMGMLRFDQHSGLFANEKGVDDLYTLGYMLHLAKRDRPDRLLVTFYGKLAQGLTRDTFIGAEGTSLVPLDEHGRPMYLPPNAASNALWLWTLRYLAVQDFDLDDDGRPDTLRLLAATPPRWLRDGAAIRFQQMPTAFGPVSIHVESRLSRGEVLADLTLPPRAPKQTLLRIRLPGGWKATGATLGEDQLAVAADGTVDLTGRNGACRLHVQVSKP